MTGEGFPPLFASVYGAYFENRSIIPTHKDVIFYGRYIDDCIGIVYAESKERALALLKDNIIFDQCVIEWAVSQSSCQFLDAFLYSEHGKLCWRPFVKAGNNRERIPWVSHHPLDVKRGVYIGEYSRLAVLCSSVENYIGAIKDLNSLYVLRGYPEKLVYSWCKRFSQERWEKRFAPKTDKGPDESVLVLKSRFDDVWNYFSATELGKTITEYWSEWLTRFEEGRFTADPARPFLPYDPAGHDITDILPTLWVQGCGRDGSEEYSPDLHKIGLLGSQWIVS
jgi:hypothetical protein